MNAMRMCIGLAILAACGCANKNQSESTSSTVRPTKMTASTMPIGRNPSAKAIRIDAGAKNPFVDADGNTWQPDSGFTGGGMVDRGNIQIANTRNPAMYRTEHWGMNVFSTAVRNGRYNVVLHFAETYPEITAAGQRVFTVKVEDHEIKDLDVFKEAGGSAKALVKTVPVDVSDGKLDITFTFGEQNPEINGIEIIPQ
ncbi:MAG TPA: malectin [Tepidisphaeraceae bacterium]|nr:malectin [Tepidisphaeraceae bacterium]